MTNPISCSSSRGAESVEALIHDVTSSPDAIRLDATPPVVDESTMGEEMAHTAGVKVAEHAIDHALGGPFAGPWALLFELGHGAASDFRVGRERGELYEYDKMRGALAVFEGRVSDPSVQAEIARNPAFADGTRRAERVIAQDSELTGRLIRAVDATVTEGYAAVVGGRDQGPQFARRYANDLCFRHAVDYARGQRDAGGTGWQNVEARVAANCRLAEASLDRVPLRA